MSSIQVAILFEYSKYGKEPTRITEIIAALANHFEEYWVPKKGTIYPSVHNLNVRGYLKMHAVKPYGYSITPKGKKTVDEIIKNIEKQMNTYMHYYTFILKAYSETNKVRAKEVRDNILNSIKKFIEK